MLRKTKDILRRLFRKKDPTADPFSSNKQLLKVYLSYRILGKKLHKDIFNYIPKNAIQICGKKLGIIGKTLSLNCSIEIEVLVNYCIYHYYIENKNAIDRYIATNRETLSGDKKIVALAMERAQFAILEIDKVMSHGGVLVTDMLRGGKQELLIDSSFSKAAIPGMILASTIMRHPQFIMSTGAPLPINSLSCAFESLIEDYHKKQNDFDSMSKMQQSKFIANLLKICIREETSENITHQDN